jgi:cell division protein FtsB
MGRVPARQKDRDVMRDIGERIQRYRLTRYGPRDASLLRRLAWVWPILALWAVYALFLGEHSLLRIWKLSREDQRMRHKLVSTRKELDQMEDRMNDPRVIRDRAEHVLRERSGFAKPGEIIYRTPETKADTSGD